MTDRTGIYGGGRWQDRATIIGNRNPPDLSDVIGHYGQADAVQPDRALAAAAAPGRLPPRERRRHAAGFHTSVKTACVAAGAPE